VSETVDPRSEPTAEWERIARGASAPQEEEREPELLRELLTFELDGTDYAVPVERVREIIRQFINARHTHEIIFTRNGTESINLMAAS